VANKACLGSDLAKEWGDVSSVRGGQCRSKNARESKAVIGMEKWASLCACLLMRRGRFKIHPLSSLIE
jgi:hypothetical protein